MILERRRFLLGLGATAPAVILTPGLLMPIKAFAMPKVTEISTFAKRESLFFQYDSTFYEWTGLAWMSRVDRAPAPVGLIPADYDQSKSYHHFVSHGFFNQQGEKVR